jgi:hypothetical protein
MTPVLYQEEPLSAGHHAHAEAGKIGVEGDVIFGRDLQRLDRPFGNLDFRHPHTHSRNVPTFRFLAGLCFVEASWKRRDESRGEALRKQGRSGHENKSSLPNGLA